MNNRQKKKQYCKQHGYNPAEEKRIRQLIGETIEYTEQRLIEAEKERVNRTYSDFLKNIKERRKAGWRWKR